MAREIPQREWSKFLTDFTDANQGREACINIDGRSIGEDEGEEALLLTGIEAGVQAEDDDTIIVEMADLQGPQQGHVTHRFEDVAALRLRDEQGSVEGLEIETRDGTHAVLHLGEEIPVNA